MTKNKQSLIDGTSERDSKSKKQGERQQNILANVQLNT